MARRRKLPGELRNLNGAENRFWRTRHQQVSVQSTVDFPIVINPRKGERATLYDADGNAYIDFGFVGTDNFGFGSTLLRIRRAVDRIDGVLFLPEHDIANILGVSLKSELLSRTPVRGQGAVFFARSGADANEVALDAMIKARPERRTFGCFWGAFHGRNTGIRSLMDPRKPQRVADYPKPYDVIRLPFPAATIPGVVKALKAQLAEISETTWSQMNGFFIEIVQGEGGMQVIDTRALRVLVEELRRHDVAIVVDEVQTGMGRTGTLWAYRRPRVTPDIVTIGKSLGGGVQDVNAVVMSRRFSFREAGARSSTFGAEPAKAAAALAALAEIDRRNLCARAEKLGLVISRELRALRETFPSIQQVQGIGAMWGIEFRDTATRDAVRHYALTRGLILLPCGIPNVNPSIRIMPPLVISRSELHLGLRILKDAIAATETQ